ncbi:MAG: hypothetical protein AB8G77_01145 [Rhodothermales bacterium]
MRLSVLILLTLPIYASQMATGQVREDVVAGLVVDSLQVSPGEQVTLQPFVVANSEQFVLEGRVLQRGEYALDNRFGLLTLIDSTAAGLLVARYRTLPFGFQKSYVLREGLSLEDVADTSNVIEDLEAQSARASQSARDPFGDSKVQRSGSITRGIVAGNNRDVTVESGLRMQLSGEIVDGVDVQAVLTDENTPIQPEGTTQRLNEFDRVFIQIQSRKGTVQLGDFDINYKDSEFARFTRKLQGIHLFSDLPSVRGNEPAVTIDVAGATSRGIFRTQEIEPIDGIQGPYRLEGENGEQFIIIVAGSEVVYLDGVAMIRGETNDYVVDYATGEITFTPNRIVTSDRRINVEFQYTTNQFSRTLTGAAVTANLWPAKNGNARSSFGVTFVREADGDLFNEEFGLTSADSLQIISAGDGLAQRSGAEPVIYDPEAPYVQYIRQLLIPENPESDTIFVAVETRPADSVEVFRVRFTRVGSRNGSYVRLGRGVNGILYEYRGAGQGEYEPVRILPKPANHNVLDFNGRLEPIQNVELFGEWARSFNDQNRLSSFDGVDDIDHAYKTGIRIKPIPVSFGFAERGHVEGEGFRRQIGANFESFDRIRPVEFGRKWNLNARSVSATGGVLNAGDEEIDEANLAVYFNPQLFVKGEIGSLDLAGAFKGRRNAAEFGLVDRVSYLIESISSDDNVLAEQGSWFRQKGALQHPIFGGRFTPRFEFEQERREQRAASTDSLTMASLSFTEYRPGISWGAERLEASLLMEFRDEQDWAEGELRDASKAWTYQTQFNYRPGTVFNTDGSVGYRVRRFSEYFRTNLRREDAESVLLRWNTQWRPAKKAIELTTRYEASTERTPTLQEIYIRTGPELGQYVWEDVNEDGAIQIDEFLPERTPNEGAYVKTFIPSDSLSSIISVRARVRLQFEPSRIWGKEAAGLKKILRQVSSRTTFEVQEKSREEDIAQIYLLSLDKYRSSLNTLNGRIRFSQDLLLFRSIPKIGLDFRFNQLRSLSELAAGEESRFLNVWSVEGRFAPTRKWGFKMRAETEDNRLGSEAFASRRYDIEGIRLEPEISFSPTNTLSFVGSSDWAKKTDNTGDRTASVLKLPFEVRLRKIRKAQVSARFEVAFVKLEGEALGLSLFELTDGRGAGTSYLWGLNGDYTLNQFLRLSFAYDGRSPADAPTLHTLRVQMSALF